MRRVLSECSASVRKSLQGLDYFAAEGARAFDNLISLVRQVGLFAPGHDWEKRVIQCPKTQKLYLKGYFKLSVTLCNCMSNDAAIKILCHVYA